MTQKENTKVEENEYFEDFEDFEEPEGTVVAAAPEAGVQVVEKKKINWIQVGKYVAVGALGFAAGLATAAGLGHVVGDHASDIVTKVTDESVTTF